MVGATGTLGRKVAKTLLASGEDVRVMTRSLARADELKSLGARPVRANLNDPESLEFAVRGVKSVIASAHGLLGRGHESSEAIDHEGHRALIDAAKEAGVGHFIYTSVLNASDDHPIDFWRTKARVERYLRDSGLTYTILRPSSFMDTHAYMLLGKNVIEGKRVVVPGKGNNPRNFVAAEDVAKVIVGALRIPSLRGETIDVGGPENLTNSEVIAIFERLSGKKAKVTHLPIRVLRAMSPVAGRAHPGVGRIMQAMIDSETRDQRFDPSVLRSRIPITLTSLESWARNRIRPLS
ncbi:MAG TPA: SDR family oxidoreductase [Gemmatimonadaceae bacterium]